MDLLNPVPTVYGDIIPWERPVQLAAQFFTKKGDTILDVGGNTGGVAIAFSRMVGPSGKVYSFECNPKMIDWIKMDCTANNIDNIEIVPFAAYKEENVELSFYLDESFYSAASSLHRSDLKRKMLVKTTTIDSLCESRKISPALIKLDIEGGEADALTGAMETIHRCRPIMIMEFNPCADNNIKLIQNLNYRVYDLNNYRPVDEAYFQQTFSTNVVCLPREKSLEFELGSASHTSGGVTSVDAGCGVIEFDLLFSGTGVGSLNCVGPDGKMIAYFEAEFHHLKHHSCSTIPFCSSVPGQVSCEVRCMSGDGEISIIGSAVEQLRLVRLAN